MRAIKGQPVAIVLALSTMLFALSSYAFAQQLKKTPRIGLLLSGFPSGAARRIQAFQQGLRELGHVEGKNMVVEYRGRYSGIQKGPALPNFFNDNTSSDAYSFTRER